MNFLNQAYAQTVELFRSMTPAARITAALLLAVVVVSLAYLFHLQTADTQQYVFGGQEYTQAELGAMEAAFAKAGLGKWDVVGNRIRVPRGLKEKYIAALVDNGGMPKHWGDETKEATKPDPFGNARQLADRKQHAKERELSLVISKMKGISLATVQIDEVEKGFPRRKERSALVAVQPEGNLPLEDDRVKAIQRLMVAAIAGIDPANVAVTDLVANVTHSAGADGRPSDENLYDKNKQIFERSMQKKIYDLLSMYPGIKVEVNVELNTEVEHRTQSTKIEPKAVALQTSDQTKEMTTTAPGPGGRPGAVPNGVGANAPAQVASTAGAQSQTTETRNEQKLATGQEQTTIQKLGLTPKRITTSIAVPTSYFAKVWRQLNPPAVGAAPKDPDPAELRKIEDDVRTKIENSVVSLLPPVERGVDKYPLVTVTTYTDLPQTPLTPPTLTENAQTWLAGNWQTLGLVTVGLFSLVMLRGMLRPSPSPTPAAADASPALQLAAVGDEETPAAGEGETPTTRKRRFRAGGPSLRDELTDMVKDDPDAAANVLRSWIGDAA